MRTYYVYIMASLSGVLYTGVTNNLSRRVYEHKHGGGAGFTKKYRVTRLVYYETFSRIQDAIAAEKTIKGWVRIKKERLITEMNPTWSDLSQEWEADLWWEG